MSKLSKIRTQIFCILLVSCVGLFYIFTLDDSDNTYDFHKQYTMLEKDGYDFNLNPGYDLCDPSQNKTHLFIVFVIIAPNAFEQRQLIRNTWAGNQNKLVSSEFRVFFSVGFSKNETINKQIEKEFNAHKDILRINNYIDHYYNCTYKIMKTLKWIARYCPNMKYALKICDDVVVNTPQLIADFTNMKYKPNHMYGHIYYSAKPIRNPKDKWYVSEKDFTGVYDPYPQGNNKKNRLKVLVLL
jgi:hypothetical protein